MIEPDASHIDLVAKPLPALLSVQYLRALACLSVLAFHACGGGRGTFYIGQAGVDLFFVISGFIMLLIVHSGENSPSIFVAKRLTRLLPLYWTLTILLFLKRTLSSSSGNSLHAKDLLTSLLFIPSDSPDSPIILQGWTLNYEVFFYAIIALGLLLGSRRLVGTMCILSALVVAGFVFRPTQAVSFAYTSPLLFEFMLGIFIAEAVVRGRAASPRWGLLMVSVGSIIFVGQFATGLTLAEWRPLSWGLPSAILVFGLISAEQSLHRVTLLKRLGDASYGIYLVHGRVLNPLISFRLSPAVIALIGIPASLAVHLFERRCIRTLRAM